MSNNRSIDKDEMYRKIMPSAQIKERTQEENTLSEPVVEMKKIKDETKPQPSYIKPKLLINVSEHAVNQRREEAMTRLKSCMCDRCIKDVIALAVNKLAPKYIVAYEEDIEREISKYHGDVVTALVNAILIVKNHPRH
ncbi:MAG: late competence development ComFB family protein [Erysipelothrix sp.]|nr:late competence development ComFB family protein [Erysipelothrix sp.]